MINFRMYFYACMAARFAGAPISADWIYAQWAYETDNFTSALCRIYHNCGGLTQEEPNDLPQPDGELYYKEFCCYASFAEYFGSYLQAYRSNGLFDAYDLVTYLTALRDGGYFGQDLSTYVRGCQSYAPQKA